jgi:hypothetical protein
VDTKQAQDFGALGELLKQKQVGQTESVFLEFRPLSVDVPLAYRHHTYRLRKA